MLRPKGMKQGIHRLLCRRSGLRLLHLRLNGREQREGLCGLRMMGPPKFTGDADGTQHEGLSFLRTPLRSEEGAEVRKRWVKLGVAGAKRLLCNRERLAQEFFRLGELPLPPE
jgi:hypothetical protein